MRQSVKILVILVIVAVAALVAATQGVGQGNRPAFAHSDLTIVKADGSKIAFAVEVASTPAEQSYGLMFIHSLADNKGMIFPSQPPREVAFWMKNTLIPLDMLFIRPDHTIGRIVANAKPEDLTPIPSQMPVIAVIEIKGGMASQKGLAVGDKIQTPVLDALSP